MPSIIDSGLRTQDSGLRLVLSISAPRIESEADNSRLIFNLEDPVKGTYPLYFEVNSKYEQYLTSELSDSALVCVLLYAMENDYDIACEGAVSERIYNQLTNYFIPGISQNIPRYRKISIKCETSDIEFHPQGVGTALSCGVDSFYTVLKNLNHDVKSKLRITHLCCFNAGASGSTGEKSRRLYLGRARNDEIAAKELGCEFFTCDSNMSEFLLQSHLMTHTLRTLAVPLAVQKLFSLYYFSSGYQFSNFHFTDYDPAYYDIFTLPLLSNQNTRFELVGGETTRLGKVEYIAQHEITHRHLNVCVGGSIENDSTCGKCIRTMLELYLAGKLDDYNSVFDVERFKRHKKRYIRTAIYEKHNTDMAEIVKELKQRNEINSLDYIAAYVHNFTKKLARKIMPRKLKDFLKKFM